MAVLFLPTIGALIADPRRLDGERVWVKPLKFEIALAIHFATLGVALDFLDPDVRHGGVVRTLIIVSTISTIFEMAYIGVRAGQRQRSHFDVTTPVRAAMYAAMAVGAVIIIGVAGVMGVLIIGHAEALTSTLRLAFAAGFIGATALTLMTAFAMGSRLTRYVGVEADDAPRMPVTGWSRTVGDLRPSHFASTHMMQVVPLVGLVAHRLAPPVVALAIVALVSLVWVKMTLALLAMALQGNPLSRKR